MDVRRGWTYAAVLAGCTAVGCTLGPKRLADLNDPVPIVRARAMAFGEDQPIEQIAPEMIARLDDPDPVVRMMAHDTLTRRTGKDFGYRAWQDRTQRMAGQARWRAWFRGERVDMPSPQGGELDSSVTASSQASVPTGRGR